MKKFLIVAIVVLCFGFNFSFGYNQTSKDLKSLESIYKTLDTIYEKSPGKIENLYKKLSIIKPKLKVGSKNEFLILNLEKYVGNLISKKGYLVTNVFDGDTVEINFNGEDRKIRLIGVDTPEKSALRFGYVECYGKEAKEYLENKVIDKEIFIKFDKTQSRTDNYGRLLAYVFLGDENINNSLIKDGFGFEYTFDKDYIFKKDFLSSQSIASKSTIGLWSNESCSGERKKIEKTEGLDKVEQYFEKDKKIFNKNVFSIYKKDGCSKDLVCKNMGSCEEVYYYYNYCSFYNLDGDNDGVPCENVCK